MSAKELWETTMDPANRVLIQVAPDDTATADELSSVLMAKDVCSFDVRELPFGSEWQSQAT